nr:thioredoxin family protein [Candidatus Gracilibacteria bacterium]
MNLLDKLMVFGAKTMKKHTSFMLRTPEELKNLIEKKKKSVVVFGHPLCKPCQKIMMKLPIIYLKLKFRGYTLNFCNIKEIIECAKTLGIKKTPTLIVYKNGELVKRIDDEKEIFAFL